MTRRDRVLQAIQHRETDVVPYQVGLTQQARERLTRYTGDPDYIDRIGNHLSLVYYDGYLQERPDRSGYWQDHFGVLWNRNGADKDIGAIEGAVLQTPSLRGYHFPDARRGEAPERVCCRRGPARRIAACVGAIGFSLFERAWTLARDGESARRHAYRSRHSSMSCWMPSANTTCASSISPWSIR